ncbi:nitroreductase/quinone reductase family protein [Actinomadura fulvescens]|uniref:nitroreductase/quinone reductase family protein n=1 Tax=Actinomadura fulvescens TaxID=46160 RepID=UPI0031D28477
MVAEPFIELQDGTVTREYRARQVFGDEKALWWRRAVDRTRPMPTTSASPTARSRSSYSNRWPVNPGEAMAGSGRCR